MGSSGADSGGAAVDVSRAAEVAREILASAGVTQPPVPVEEIAAAHGAELSYEPFRGGISGMLYRDDDRQVIGVNASHAATRQRFTIAHELGHLLLHERRKLIVDSHIYLRDDRSSMGTYDEEVDANAFAAELLMPEEMVRTGAEALIDEKPAMSANQLVRGLAKTFEVSEQAMEIRLGALRILSPLIIQSG